MLRVAIAVAVLAIYVYGLVDVIRTDATLTRGFSKTTWIIIVVFLPIVGAALWFLIGRPRYEAPVRRAYAHPTAPDDDPQRLADPPAASITASMSSTSRSIAYGRVSPLSPRPRRS